MVILGVSPRIEASASSSGEQALKPGEATIWYLGHCGFAVRTETKLLVFDYVKKAMRRGEPAPPPPAQPALANGWINPEEIKDLDVVVFVSHNHGDHYDEVIRTWAKTVKNIHYVFGWDAGTGANVHSLTAPRASAKFDGLDIDTVNSHHSGVPESAFLVKVDGLTIFHNGDYVGRMGDYNTAPSNVPADMDYLTTKFKTMDILFLDAFVADYQIQILQSLKPNVLFPMHYGGQEEKLKPFAADLKKAGVEIPVYCSVKPGDRFEYRNGKIVPFKNPNPENAAHSVQYVSHPTFTWQKLRAERMGQFEKPVRPVPDPNGWFHARVVVTASKVSVYVDGATDPCLDVEKLGNRGEGRVGLFVGNNSGGDFADLKIIPAKTGK